MLDLLSLKDLASRGDDKNVKFLRLYVVVVASIFIHYLALHNIFFNQWRSKPARHSNTCTMKKVTLKELQKDNKLTILKKEEAKVVKGGFIVVDDLIGF